MFLSSVSWGPRWILAARKKDAQVVAAPGKTPESSYSCTDIVTLDICPSFFVEAEILCQFLAGSGLSLHPKPPPSFPGTVSWQAQPWFLPFLTSMSEIPLEL